jgi:DNA (cytosine-5)-methyltransferase 1
MKYLSVCSGIESATVAWRPLGFRAAAFAEIEAFPSAVLAHHYPSVPNLGDLTKFKEWPDVAIDLFVGGTPCQSFSVAGLRAGLADPRGNLALTYLAVAERYRPRWLVWENVPGVLSSGRGRDFGAFLGGLGELGYGFCYRVLDAQYFGLAQRRKRVFVVGYLGDWRRAAAVLFERESLSGHPAPRHEARQEVAGPIGAGSKRSGGRVGRREAAAGHVVAFSGNNAAGPIDIATAVNAHGGACGRMDFESETFIAHSLRGSGFDASEDGTGRGTPLIAFDTTQITSKANYSNPQPGDQCHPLAAGAHPPAVAFANTAGATNLGYAEEQAPPITGRHGDPGNVMSGMRVRRLTPRECERLQGFPDDYTMIPYRGKPAADGPRYKALGNSMAVPVMRWIGRRIQAADAAIHESAA